MATTCKLTPSQNCEHYSCGCLVTDCCLNCPLAQCVFEDNAPTINEIRLKLRDERIEALLSRDFSAILIAEVVGVSERTVHRLVRFLKLSK